jgi:lysophospholipase L1-like esterase
MTESDFPGRGRSFGRVSAKALLLASAIVFALVLMELGLRLFAPLPARYFVLPPTERRIFRPEPGAMPGVSKEARFRVNSQGLRGDELTPDKDLIVLALGGSTTECVFLDQDETWPALLQRRMAASGHRAWVGNGGLSGRTTRENVPQLRQLLSQFPTTLVVVLLIGANDLLSRLSLGDEYRPTPIVDPKAEALIVPKAFSVFPVRYAPGLPFWQRTELWARTRAAVEGLRLSTEHVEDQAGRSYVVRRERRRSATLTDVLPDLTSALEEYSENVERMIAIAEKRVPLVFITQPAMWREGLPADLDALLWMGDAGSRQKPPLYYSPRALAEGLRRYNETLLRICSAHDLPCLDLAPRVPKDASVFYDDLHFNRHGAELVASILGDFLSSRVLAPR